MTALAATAPAAKRRLHVDLSMPVLLLFAAVLCLLIVMPLGWLAAYAFTDKTGAFTLANFRSLVVDAAYLDPLLTTFALAILSAVICCAVAAPMGWLVARTDMPLAPHGPPAGDGLVRHAAVPRRHRLGAAGGAEQRPAQSAVSRSDRRGRRQRICSTSIRSPASSSSSAATPFLMSSCWSPMRSTARPAISRTPPPSSAAAPGYTARAHHHSAGAAGARGRRAGRVPPGDDAVRLAGDPGDAGRLPHHDHQDLEPVPVSAEARTRRRRLAAAAAADRHPAARAEHGARPPRLCRGRRQEQRAAPGAPRRLQMAGARLEHAGADVPGVPAVFRAAQCELLQGRLARRQRQ